MSWDIQKEVSRKWPAIFQAAYELLPSRMYFLDIGYIRDPLDLDGNGFKRSSDEVLGYNQTLHFLKNAREDICWVP